MYTMNHILVCVVGGALLCAPVLSAPSDSEGVTELVLAHVVFRHGARTTYKFYPNDPYKNLTFYPVGLGGLTNEGKYGEYKLGQWLRTEYGAFLGDLYTENLLRVRSTDTLRTKMSAQLVLAGMWPPKEEQIWHPELAWQPIPVFFKENKDEDLISPSVCDYRTRLLADLPNRADVREFYVNPYKGLFDFITENSGLEINTLVDLLDFYFIVSTEDELGLTLPDWTKEIYPEPLIGTTALVYEYWNYDDGVKRINVGYLLKKMLDDSLSKINGTASPDDIKMFMYSGHESTLGYLLDVLKVTEAHIPPYGSAVILELRKDAKDNYFFLLKYRKDSELKPIVLTIPGCEVLCPIEKFEELQRPNLPVVSFKEACSLAALKV